MSRDHMDSATLAARDCACGGTPEPRVADKKRRKYPRKDARLSDPGGGPGPSIKCPDIYEALKRQGYSKEKAAKVSNSKAGTSGCH